MTIAATAAIRADPVGWRFDNGYARLPDVFFDPTAPRSGPEPRLAFLDEALAAEIGLDPSALRERGAEVFAGGVVPRGAEPIAMAYAGHQYGHFTNLGDGRAILLGEHVTPRGERVDVHLKGAGATRYARRGDGRAALGPMLREAIIGGAMHALGIPTTRALAVATTGDAVWRGVPLTGAVLARVAASHVRIGTFEYARAIGDPQAAAALLAYTLARHDPDALEAADPAALLLERVIERQAALVARWQHVGFVHGVMNTDNVAISGETIDYGPCAFLDAYDPDAVFSSIDERGRYAFGRQSQVMHWNLARFAEALLGSMRGPDPLERARGAIASFPERFERHYLSGARAKLGLSNEEADDAALHADFLTALHESGADFTLSFAALADAAAGDHELPAALHAWGERWQARLARQPEGAAGAVARLRGANPLVIPRNHRVEEALAAAEAGDLRPTERLLAAVRAPFDPSTPASYREGGDGRAYRTTCGT
jgi:serine/tyrosine/threonine adenylyltransferase